MAIPNLPNHKKIHEGYNLLYQFTHHRIRYEFNDFVEHYLAFLFVPTLSLIAFLLLARVGLFNRIIPASTLEWFFIIAISTLMLWIYLCASDPGYVLDGHHRLKPYPFLNSDLKRSYKDIMEGQKIMLTTICPTCEIERPNRCKHCIKCGDCIYRMDHHCKVYWWLDDV